MLIGLSVNHKEDLSCISNAYINAVIKAGGTPVLIPLTNDKKVLDEVLSRIDGLLLSGGGDIHPSFFNEELHPAVERFDLERDNYDLYLARMAAKKSIPILGICRGHQLINVAFGGSLIQDIPSQVPLSTVNHNQSEARETGTHVVSIRLGSTLHGIIQSDNIPVNSFHHQAVKVVAPGFEAVAFSEDGINEAIESSEGNSILGVQWHPENMAIAGNEAMVDTFRYLLSEAALYRKAKEIHKRIISIDSHTDTPMYFPYGIDIGKRNPTLQVNPHTLGLTNETGNVNYQLKVNIPTMEEGMLDAVVMVAYLPQGSRTIAASQKTANKTFSILNTLLLQIEKNKEKAALAKTPQDIMKIKKEGKKAILLGVENGYGIGKDLRNLQKLADMGVVYITLSHNGDNDICDAAMKSKQEHNGLSEFGKEVVKEMNRLGIMIDISHTSEKTSLDVLEITEHPIIASHSSVKSLCNHPRNISDKLMAVIAKNGGVVQICLYAGFLKKKGKANVKDAVDHIDYIVKKVGIDYVGIGSDFDGGGGLIGLKSASEMPKITIELLRRGYSEEDIAKIWGGNLLRVMEKNRRE
jgi:microsomal dipeptidase-like Zn-dependent dipeptidase/gamma-glutamyl-gamma-aminobutyrate hydrolase PuuD